MGVGPKKVPRYRLIVLWAVFSSFGDVSKVIEEVFVKGLGSLWGREMESDFGFMIGWE